MIVLLFTFLLLPFCFPFPLLYFTSQSHLPFGYLRDSFLCLQPQQVRIRLMVFRDSCMLFLSQDGSMRRRHCLYAMYRVSPFILCPSLLSSRYFAPHLTPSGCHSELLSVPVDKAGKSWDMILSAGFAYMFRKVFPSFRRCCCPCLCLPCLLPFLSFFFSCHSFFFLSMGLFDSFLFLLYVYHHSGVKGKHFYDNVVEKCLFSSSFFISVYNSSFGLSAESLRSVHHLCCFWA